MNSYRRVFIILGWLLSLPVFATDMPNAPHISVTGVGEVSAVPDAVKIFMNIQKRGMDLVTVKNSADQTSAQFIKLAEKFGVEKKDIATAELNITAEQNYDNVQRRSVFVGYLVGRGLTVTLRDLKQYSNFMQEVVAIGVDNISRVELISSKQAELDTQATILAIEDSKSKAETIAKQYGKTILGVYSITDSPVQEAPVGRAMSAMKMGDSAGNFEPGDIKVSRSMYAVFLLGDK